MVSCLQMVSWTTHLFSNVSTTHLCLMAPPVGRRTWAVWNPSKADTAYADVIRSQSASQQPFIRRIDSAVNHRALPVVCC